MKLTEIVALFYLIGAWSCNAFAPSINQVGDNIKTRTTQTGPLNVNAKLLEGWKVDGVVNPLNNFILVKAIEDADQTESGILVTTKITKYEGTVISTGPGTFHADSGIPYPMPVNAGDGVIYGEYDGIEFDIDGGKYTLIRDTDILVKYTGSADNIDTVFPVNDSVLVYVDTDISVTKGGLLLGDTTSESRRPSTGKVVKVGPGRMAADGELMPMTVEIGDMVKFRDFLGNDVKIDGKEYSVVAMPDVLAKF